MTHKEGWGLRWMGGGYTGILRLALYKIVCVLSGVFVGGVIFTGSSW